MSNQRKIEEALDIQLHKEEWKNVPCPVCLEEGSKPAFKIGLILNADGLVGVNMKNCKQHHDRDNLAELLGLPKSIWNPDKNKENGVRVRLEKAERCRRDDPDVRMADVRTISAADLRHVKFLAPKYLVDGLISNGVNLLTARPKIGKSWMALQLALSVTTGGKFLGRTVTVSKKPILYIGLEDTRRRLQGRLRHLIGKGGRWPKRLHLADIGSWPRMGEDGLEHLMLWCAKHHPALIVIDTFAKFKPRSVRGGDAGEEAADTMAALQKLCADFDCAVLVLHHDRKAEAFDPVDIISGHTQIAAGADTLLLLKRERRGRDAVLFVTGRDVEDQKLGLVWEASRRCWEASEHVPPEKPLTPERRAIWELLRKHDEPMGPKKIARIVDKDIDLVRHLLRKMDQDEQIKRTAHGKYSL